VTTGHFAFRFRLHYRIHADLGEKDARHSSRLVLSFADASSRMIDYVVVLVFGHTFRLVTGHAH
jgi:hypothetical protein